MEINSQMERRLGAAVGLLNVIVNLVTRLLLVPIILYYLDGAEFGLYQLIGAFVGYLALVDFGISGTLGRFIAKFKALKDDVSQDNIFAMCIIVYSIIAVLISLIGFSIYYNLDVIFSKSLAPEEMSEAKIMFIILLLSISATVFGRAFVGVNAGHERFVFSRISETVCVLAKVGMVSAVLYLGYRAIGIVVVEAIINIAVLVLNAVYAFMVLKVRFRLHYWDWTLCGEAFSFAFWTFMAALVLQINFRLGSVLLGVMTTTSLVGVYAIALQINTLYNMLPTTISSVFLPRITRLVVEGADGDQLTKTIISPSRYQLMLMGCVLGGFILYGRQFISLWAGAEFIEAWVTALAILIPVTIPLCQNTILCVLQAKMLNRDRAIITMTFAVISGISAVYLIGPLGLYGPAVATGLALLIGHGLVMNIYYHRCVGLNMWLFFKKATEKIVIALVFATVMGSIANYLPFGTGWVGLLIKMLFYIIIYVFSMWLYGMKQNERLFFLATFWNSIKAPYVMHPIKEKAK